MVSERQLIANQNNGQLGGVKTEAGKAVSKVNAVPTAYSARKCSGKEKTPVSLTIFGEGIKSGDG